MSEHRDLNDHVPEEPDAATSGINKEKQLEAFKATQSLNVLANLTNPGKHVEEPIAGPSASSSAAKRSSTNVQLEKPLVRPSASTAAANRSIISIFGKFQQLEKPVAGPSVATKNLKEPVLDVQDFAGVNKGKKSPARVSSPIKNGKQGRRWFRRSSKVAVVPLIQNRRLLLDYMELKNDPLPYIYVEPLPANLLEWHYVLRGPPDTPFAEGLYHGKLEFPPDFPFRPPAIYMITPSGRFRPNFRLCLSMSDYHPQSWNPLWSCGTIIQGILSFMVEHTSTLGSILSSDEDKRLYALASYEFNLQDKIFCELFPDLVEEMKPEVPNRAKATAEIKKQNKVTFTDLFSKYKCIFQPFSRRFGRR